MVFHSLADGRHDCAAIVSKIVDGGVERLLTGPLINDIRLEVAQLQEQAVKKVHDGAIWVVVTATTGALVVMVPWVGSMLSKQVFGHNIVMVADWIVCLSVANFPARSLQTCLSHMC